MPSASPMMAEEHDRIAHNPCSILIGFSSDWDNAIDLVSIL
jgi:hypothetical protein